MLHNDLHPRGCPDHNPLQPLSPWPETGVSRWSSDMAPPEAVPVIAHQPPPASKQDHPTPRCIGRTADCLWCDGKSYPSASIPAKDNAATSPTPTPPAEGTLICNHLDCRHQGHILSSPSATPWRHGPAWGWSWGGRCPPTPWSKASLLYPLSPPERTPTTRGSLNQQASQDYVISRNTPSLNSNAGNPSPPPIPGSPQPWVRAWRHSLGRTGGPRPW